MKRHLDFENLGEYLKQKRLKADMSQREVAKSLGYSNPQFVSNFERGLCSPPFPKLKVLVEIYKIPVAEITEKLIDIQRATLNRIFAEDSKPRDGSGKRTKKKAFARLSA